MSHTKLARSRLNVLSKFTTITTFCDYGDGHARWWRSKWLPRTFVQASAAAAAPVHRHRRRENCLCLSRTVWTSLRQTSNTTTPSFITDFNEVYYTVSFIHLLRWLIQIQTQSSVLICKAECLCESEYVYVFVWSTKTKKHRWKSDFALSRAAAHNNIITEAEAVHEQLSDIHSLGYYMQPQIKNSNFMNIK